MGENIQVGNKYAFYYFSFSLSLKEKNNKLKYKACTKVSRLRNYQNWQYLAINIIYYSIKIK